MSIKKYLEKLEDFSGKEILITGGTSGIGLSLGDILPPLKEVGASCAMTLTSQA